jgi:hypothetical protein
MFVVRANFMGQKKIWLKIERQKITQLISRLLVRKTRYEAGICHFRLLSKASNTGFSRHVKTGCHLPVCITIWIFDLRFLAFNNYFLPADPRNRRFKIFRLWKSNLRDRKVDINFWVPDTYEQPPGPSPGDSYNLFWRCRVPNTCVVPHHPCRTEEVCTKEKLFRNPLHTIKFIPDSDMAFPYS